MSVYKMVANGYYSYTCPCGSSRMCDTERQRDLYRKLHNKKCPRAATIFIDVDDKNGIDYRTRDTLKITQARVKLEQEATDKLLNIFCDDKLAMRK